MNHSTQQQCTDHCDQRWALARWKKFAWDIRLYLSRGSPCLRECPFWKIVQLVGFPATAAIMVKYPCIHWFSWVYLDAVKILRIAWLFCLILSMTLLSLSQGLGWVHWKSREYLPESLLFHLGDRLLTQPQRNTSLVPSRLPCCIPAVIDDSSAFHSSKNLLTLTFCSVRSAFALPISLAP